MGAICRKKSNPNQFAAAAARELVGRAALRIGRRVLRRLGSRIWLSLMLPKRLRHWFISRRMGFPKALELLLLRRCSIALMGGRAKLLNILALTAARSEPRK